MIRAIVCVGHCLRGALVLFLWCYIVCVFVAVGSVLIYTLGVFCTGPPERASSFKAPRSFSKRASRLGAAFIF